MGSLFRTWTGQSGKSQQSHQSPQTPSQPLATDPLQKITSTASTADPWAGHLNHLTSAQEKALGQFKSVLYDQDLYKPVVERGGASHDDATLLRFLRARKFDVNAALGQFKDTEHWRKTNDIRSLYENFDVNFYEKARTMYPQWTGRRDRRGIPLYVYVIRHLDGKNVGTYTKDSAKMKAQSKTHSTSAVSSKMLPLFALYENMLHFVLPLCSTLERPNPECPATNCTNIVDISQVGLKQFWNLKGHMQEASTLATAQYPETLDRIFIIGAPSFFPTVWGWIKRWFDPVTVSKIFILGQHEVKPTLEKFIDPENIPKAYGGGLDWHFGKAPSLDVAAANQCNKTEKGWVPGPVLWEDDERIPVGTVNGKPRRPLSTPRLLKETNGQINVSPTSNTSTAPHGMEFATPAEKPTSLPEKKETVNQPLPVVAQPTSDPPIAPPASSAPAFVPVSEVSSPVVNGSGLDHPSETGINVSTPSAAQGAVNGTDGKTIGVSKPTIERFETAAESLPQANGAVT